MSSVAVPTHRKLVHVGIKRLVLLTNEDGWLTRYSLAQGCAQVVRVPGSPGKITLFQQYDRYVVSDSVTGYRKEFWELLDARHAFTRRVREATSVPA